MAPLVPARRAAVSSPVPRLPLTRLLGLLGLVGLVGLLPPGAAAADPSAPAVPSAAAVERSRQAAASTAGAVGRFEARLSASAQRFERLAAEVGQAVEAYNGSRVRLAAAERRARDARRRAADARSAVDASRVALGRFAAAAYRSGGDVSGLSAFLDADGLRDLVSRAAALEAVGSSRRHALDDLRSAQVQAGLLQARADRLVRAGERAAARVAGARKLAEARLAAQEQAVAQGRAERSRLVRALAAARHTTVRLERRRQAGLEQARAEMARRAAEQQARAAARAAEAARRSERARRAEEQRRTEDQRRAEEQPPAEAQRRADSGGRDAGATAPREPAAPPPPAASKPSTPKPSTPKPSTPAAAPGPPPPEPPPPVATAPAAPSGSSGSSGSTGSSSGTVSGAERAVAFARAQIGKSYQWGAAGPGSYDCSGLTMRAWEQGGLALPHYSVAQYERSAPVALADLRAGDLVFFASDASDHRSIYHVGLYAGGGQMVEAPYTGESVRLSSIWRGSLFGAARP